MARVPLQANPPVLPGRGAATLDTSSHRQGPGHRPGEGFLRPASLSAAGRPAQRPAHTPVTGLPERPASPRPCLLRHAVPALCLPPFRPAPTRPAPPRMQRPRGSGGWPAGCGCGVGSGRAHSPPTVNATAQQAAQHSMRGTCHHLWSCRSGQCT